MPTAEAELVTVSISFATQAAAEAMAEALVEHRLIACAQLWPITSIYRWQGAVERSAEVLLSAKTVRTALPAVAALVRASHSYEVPELVAQPLAWSSADYGRWVRESVVVPPVQPA